MACILLVQIHRGLTKNKKKRNEETQTQTKTHTHKPQQHKVICISVFCISIYHSDLKKSKTYSEKKKEIQNFFLSCVCLAFIHLVYI